jgi:hypothetical protein
MERITLFDIDKTIFDTKTSGERIIKNIGLVTKRTPEEIERINGEYKSGLDSTTDFDSNDFLREVSRQTGSNIGDLTEVLFNPDNFVLYPKTLTLLKKLLDEDYSLGIFSEGVLDWQMKKLILTGAIEYIDPSLIFIERRKLDLKAIEKIPNGVRVIDDKKEVIETLFGVRPDLNLVWINRLNDEKKEAPKTRTIKSLDELVAIY